mmetsp:Transcript_60702/g.120257  ORF Transcript_60702/g.120257 Transcript_60702/m.120257 type:complete len:223 (+) Transcript_60702:637-1305(+)
MVRPCTVLTWCLNALRMRVLQYRQLTVSRLMVTFCAPVVAPQNIAESSSRARSARRKVAISSTSLSMTPVIVGRAAAAGAKVATRTGAARMEVATGSDTGTNNRQSGMEEGAATPTMARAVPKTSQPPVLLSRLMEAARQKPRTDRPRKKTRASTPTGPVLQRSPRAAKEVQQPHPMVVMARVPLQARATPTARVAVQQRAPPQQASHSGEFRLNSRLKARC